MPKKYHIETKATPLDFDYVFKFKIARGENCINCGKCAKVCIYEAHKRRTDDPRIMAEPNTVVCRNCFRCIQECPRGALEKSLNKDFQNIGGSFWKPDMLLSLWKQAEDGKVPVSGAGYRGPFTGTGFDGMWTDMSEIVRPTRDGIHGREYISTSVELGRKLNHLSFNGEKLVSKIPDLISIPIPILFDIQEQNLSPKIKGVLLKATEEINTCAIMPADSITQELEKHINNIVPLIKPSEINKHENLLKKARLVAIEYTGEEIKDIPALIKRIKAFNHALVIFRIPADKDAESTSLRLVLNGAEIIHLVADYRGEGIDTKNKRLLKNIIRSVHGNLVDEGIRDEVTIIASGGIGMAEHVAKSMLCGADLTAIDIPLLVALGVRIYENPKELLLFPDKLEKIAPSVLTQRIV
ncbi:MAG TPA: glutamate synthase-related protein, partial [Dehalococcoidales bacterium]|nr:glutamate synthase-related protein [Dehalococcoidales bacterium]